MKEIILAKGRKSPGGVTQVDDADYEFLSQWKWRNLKGYVGRYEKINGKSQTVFIHRVIMQTPKGMETDHKDHNPLNNQRSNLRICTQAQNQYNSKVPKHNSSGYKGVSRQGKKFTAQISIKGKYMFLGFFNTAEEAAKVYDDAARKYHGEFYRQNFKAGQKHKVIETFPPRTLLTTRFAVSMEDQHKTDSNLHQTKEIKAVDQNQPNNQAFERNSSSYKGVCRRDKKFMARIMVGGKSICLGRFNTDIEAAQTYADAAKRLRGESSQSESTDKKIDQNLPLPVEGKGLRNHQMTVLFSYNVI